MTRYWCGLFFRGRSVNQDLIRSQSAGGQVDSLLNRTTDTLVIDYLNNDCETTSIGPFVEENNPANFH